LVAGFFYAFYPWRYQALAQLHLLQMQYLPLVVLFLDRWLEGARKRDAAALAVCVLLQALVSFYVAYGTALVVACALPWSAWRWRARLDLRRVGGVAVVGAVVAVVFGATALPYLRLRALGLIPAYGEATQAAPLGLLPGIGGMLVWYNLRSQGVGAIGYALGIVALLLARAGQRAASALATVLAIAGSVAAFGPGIPIPALGAVLPSPYGFIASWVPGASAIRAPVRFLLVAQLGFAWLAGLGVAALARRHSSSREAAMAAVAIVAALVSFRPYPDLPARRELVGANVPAAYGWLAENGAGRPLLELPRTHFGEVGRRMYFSTRHWLPIVDGYSAYPPGSSTYLHELARELPAEQALQGLWE
jgi:hypothetical protein